MEKCTNCGQTNTHLTIFVDANTGKKNYICDDCILRKQMKELDELGTENPMKVLIEIERQIDESKDIMQKLVALLKNYNRDFHIPKDDPIAQFVFNPFAMEKTTKDTLDQLYQRKDKILARLPQKERLQYELSIAEKEEKYELAAKIKKQLTDLD